MLKRFEEAGLTDRVTPLEATTGELLVTWLTPLFRDHETIEQLKEAGAEWVYGDEPDAIRGRLKGFAEHLGDRICAVWPFEAFRSRARARRLRRPLRRALVPGFRRRVAPVAPPSPVRDAEPRGASALRGPRRPRALAGARAARPRVTAREAVDRLRALGFGEREADVLADHFLDADARGKTAHGTLRIDWLATLPGLDPGAEPERVVQAVGFERWDGRGAVGYLTLAAIVEAQLASPPEQASVVVARECFPTGVLGYWVRKLAGAGLVAALTATSPPRLPHPDGGPPLTGTNALAIGVPSSDGEPVVADVSMGKVTHGDVLAGRASPEDLVPSAASRRTRGSRWRSGCSSSSMRWRARSTAPCSSSRGLKPTRCRP